MVYALPGGPYVDLAFSVTLQRERFPLGYVDFMWARYMNRTRDRRIRFYVMDGPREGWMRFGDDTPHGFETGTVAHRDVDPLAREPGAETLNLIEHAEKTFLLPFYSRLVYKPFLDREDVRREYKDWVRGLWDA